MTLPRAPCTIPNAITRIAGQIGWAEVSRIARRRERTVRYWAAPKPKGAPTIDQAVALDAAFVAAGGHGHPLLETYAQLLDVQITDRLACQRALADDLARVLRECGEAAGATIVVTQPGASPRDIHRALAETEEVHSATGAMLRRLKSFLPFGAGPNAAKAGGAHV